MVLRGERSRKRKKETNWATSSFELCVGAGRDRHRDQGRNRVNKKLSIEMQNQDVLTVESCKSE
jgi:hypothetical protein